MTDETKSPAKAKPTLAGGHVITIDTEKDDNGETHLVVRCDPCGYAQTVPAGDPAEAQRMAVNHSG